MTQPVRTHGTLGAHCFKCGQAIGPTEGVRYLNHDWCATCARKEAEVRIRRPAAREVTNAAGTNGGTHPSTPAETDLPPTIQTLLTAVGGANARSRRQLMMWGGAGAGGLLLLAGLVLVLGAPVAASTGPMLALAGTILLAAVIHRR